MAKDTFNLNEWVGNKERRLLREEHEDLTPEELANKHAGSPMHQEPGLEEQEYFGSDGDDIIEIIKSRTLNNDSSEIDEAIEVMEFIGQHYGINFEFGRAGS